ncbi:MAG: NHL repeat-containing protein [Bryobacteraceae bacterium]|nr:NHL repeat-containing protein [Bryobacteraceae bacterium]
MFFNDEWFVVADSGNHRILLWRGLPEADGAHAELVLGQPDFTTEGPKLLHLPTGVLIYHGRLLVADSWHHRVLVWNRVPERSCTAPDYAIGQSDLNSVEPNRGGLPSALSLYWPYGIGIAAGWFWIADTGNRRVLGWPSIPDRGEMAHVVLGQPSESANEENRGGAPSARSFRWPHAIAGHEQTLLVADAGNHRVLGWSSRPREDCSANFVAGQSDFGSTFELPHTPQGPARLRFPYGLSTNDGRLIVADTANNRVLVWDTIPCANFSPAAHVLGQDGFISGGENRWKAVTHDSLCWPYGLCCHDTRLAVADSGNNRVTVWKLPAVFEPEARVSTSSEGATPICV